MKIKLSILFFFFCLSANAQLDSTRIKTFNDKLLIGLFVSDNYATAKFETPLIATSLEQTFVLKPTLGVQFAYNGVVLALGTGFPISSPRFKDYDNAFAININGYLSRSEYVLWGAVRYFQGFEYDKNIEVVGVPNFFNASGSYMHIFNEKKYSFRAAHRQTEQQLKSGGSILAKVSATYNQSIDSSLMIIGNDFSGIRSQGISAFGGYGYNLKLNKNWFISALFLGGLDFQRVNFHNKNEPFYSFAPTYDFKSCVGYNSDKFYIALLFDTNNRLTINNINDNINFEYNYLKTDLRFGIRIDAPDILTKIRFLN